MKQSLALLLCIILLFAGCKKDLDSNSKVDIYLLQSFTTAIDTTVRPVTTAITNAVLSSEPLISNNEIRYYNSTSHTFYLKSNIKNRIEKFGPDKAFAVTVNNSPVYYGKFHPAFMSSVLIGLATIDPLLLPDEDMLPINFLDHGDIAVIRALDKRNDKAITDALKETRRLRR